MLAEAIARWQKNQDTRGAAAHVQEMLVQPPVGMPLAVGACVGRVVRLLPNGIAVKFVEQPTALDLDRLVARTVLPAAKTEAGLGGPAALQTTTV